MVKLTFGSASEDESGLPGPGGSGVKETEDTPRRKPGRPKGSTNRTSLDTLETKLKEKLLEELIVPVAFFSPLAAANIEARAERTAKAAVRMASKNPAVRKGIERMLDGSDAFTLLMFPLSTAICVAVDMGAMPIDAMPARAVGAPSYASELGLEHNYYANVQAPEPTMNGDGETTYSPFVGKRGLMGEVE